MFLSTAFYLSQEHLEISREMSFPTHSQRYSNRELYLDDQSDEPQEQCERVSCMSFFSKLFSRNNRKVDNCENKTTTGSQPMPINGKHSLSSQASTQLHVSTKHNSANYHHEDHRCVDLQKLTSIIPKVEHYEDPLAIDPIVCNTNKTAALRTKRTMNAEEFCVDRHNEASTYESQFPYSELTCSNCFQPLGERNCLIKQTVPAEQLKELAHNMYSHPASEFNSALRHKPSLSSMHQSMTDSGIFVSLESSCTEPRESQESGSPKFIHLPFNTEPPPSPAPPCGFLGSNVTHTKTCPLHSSFRTHFSVNQCPVEPFLDHDEPARRSQRFPISTWFPSSESASSSSTVSLNTEQASQSSHPIGSDIPYLVDSIHSYPNVDISESEATVERLRLKSQQHIEILEQLFFTNPLEKVAPTNTIQCMHDLIENLTILTEAKKVINRQMERLRNAYMELTKGQLSSKSLQTVNPEIPGSETTLPRSYSLQYLGETSNSFQNEDEYAVLQKLFGLTHAGPGQFYFP